MAAHYSWSELATILAGSISVSVAAASIRRAATALRIQSEMITVDQAEAILEHIANEPGLTGITARFAKSRVALRWRR